MGDVDRGGIELINDVTDRRQHLDLGGDVERGGRLVKDDEVGPAGHGHGGHCALQLPARYLVRITKADLVGIGKTQTRVQLHRVLLTLQALLYPVVNRGLGVLVNQLVGGIKGGGGRLCYVGNTRAA